MSEMDESKETVVNPNYVAYARAHGKTPEEMMAYDTDAWTGGCMCGFIIWISEQKTAFFKIRPDAFWDRNTIGDIEAWCAFLQDVADKSAKLG